MNKYLAATSQWKKRMKSYRDWVKNFSRMCATFWLFQWKPGKKHTIYSWLWHNWTKCFFSSLIYFNVILSTCICVTFPVKKSASTKNLTFRRSAFHQRQQPQPQTLSLLFNRKTAINSSKMEDDKCTFFP